MCDLGVSDSKSGHSYPFFSAYIAVWYFNNGLYYEVTFNDIFHENNTESLHTKE